MLKSIVCLFCVLVLQACSSAKSTSLIETNDRNTQQTLVDTSYEMLAEIKDQHLLELVIEKREKTQLISYTQSINHYEVDGAEELAMNIGEKKVLANKLVSDTRTPVTELAGWSKISLRTHEEKPIWLELTSYYKNGKLIYDLNDLLPLGSQYRDISVSYYDGEKVQRQELDTSWQNLKVSETVVEKVLVDNQKKPVLPSADIATLSIGGETESKGMEAKQVTTESL